MKKDDYKIRRIIISFPDDVTMPEGIENVFQSLAGMICQQYEKKTKILLCGRLELVQG